MKSTQIPLLFRYFARRTPKGFTLLELLVVMIIVGLLAAIALPAFLNQTSKAKQTSAKAYVGTLNRAQQAYFVEHSQFAQDMNTLGISVGNGDTANYRYTIVLSPDGRQAIHYAESLSQVLKPYVGTTAMVNTGSGEVASQTLICESEQAIQGRAPNPLYQGSSVDCAPGTKSLYK